MTIRACFVFCLLAGLSSPTYQYCETCRGANDRREPISGDPSYGGGGGSSSYGGGGGGFGGGGGGFGGGGGGFGGGAAAGFRSLGNGLANMFGGFDGMFTKMQSGFDGLERTGPGVTQYIDKDGRTVYVKSEDGRSGGFSFSYGGDNSGSSGGGGFSRSDGVSEGVDSNGRRVQIMTPQSGFKGLERNGPVVTHYIDKNGRTVYVQSGDGRSGGFSFSYGGENSGSSGGGGFGRTDGVSEFVDSNGRRLQIVTPIGPDRRGGEGGRGGSGGAYGMPGENGSPSGNGGHGGLSSQSRPALPPPPPSRGDNGGGYVSTQSASSSGAPRTRDTVYMINDRTQERRPVGNGGYGGGYATVQDPREHVH